MIRWLTDCPETTACFLPAGATWKFIPPGTWTAEDALLLDSFAPGRDGWQAWSPAEQARTVVLIDDAADSQFDVVLEATKRGALWPEQLVALALTGQRFRGQHQRPWTALRGNLHLTAHYAVDLDATRDQAALTMTPALAVAETVRQVSGEKFTPVIKWINDVFVGGGKVSGGLTATSVRGGRVERVTFGIGMNIAQTPEVEPTPFVPAAGCLADHDPSMRDLLPEIFHALVHQLDRAIELIAGGQGADIFARYRSMSGCLGKPVRIWPEGTVDWRATAPLCEGEVLALHSDLSLDVAGYPQRIRGGRMALL